MWQIFTVRRVWYWPTDNILYWYCSQLLSPDLHLVIISSLEDKIAEVIKMHRYPSWYLCLNWLLYIHILVSSHLHPAIIRRKNSVCLYKMLILNSPSSLHDFSVIIYSHSIVIYPCINWIIGVCVCMPSFTGAACQSLACAYRWLSNT